MTVHYHNRSRLNPDMEAGATYHPDPDPLLENSDFLCVACPSGPATRGLLDARRPARLPHGAIVTNISRGDLIDETALVAALDRGAVRAAGPGPEEGRVGNG